MPLLIYPKIKEKLQHSPLPLHGRMALQSAARVAADIEAGCSPQRTAAIDETVKELRKQYPGAFIPLDDNGLPLVMRIKKPRLRVVKK